jgi:hypothetical protein
MFANISISNDQGKLCATTRQELDQSNATPSYDLPIETNCLNPQIAVNIQDEQGNVLDTKNFNLTSQLPIPETNNKTKSNLLSLRTISFSIIGVLFVLSLILIIYKKRKAALMIIALLLAGGIFLGGSEEARADTVIVGNHMVYAVSLGSATEYGTGKPVTAYATGFMSWCNNTWGSMAADVTINGTRVNIFWHSDVWVYVRAYLPWQYAQIAAPSSPGYYYADFALCDGFERTCASGTWSGANHSMGYSVFGPPSITSLSNVSCNATNTQATISWLGGSGTTEYAIYYDRDNLSWSGSCSSPNPGDFCQWHSGTSITLDTTPGNGNWFAVTACKNYSCGSAEEIYFSCSSPPTMESISSATCNVAGTQATISWSGSNASSYAIYYDRDTPSWSGSCSSSNLGDFCQWHSGTSITLDTTPGNNNWFAVRAYNGGIYSDAIDRYFTCNAPSSPCNLPWGGTLTHGSNVTAYQNSTVPCNSNCVSETRTCANGVLSGTYTIQNCSKVATIGCTDTPTPCSKPCGGGTQSCTWQKSDCNTVSGYPLACNEDSCPSTIHRPWREVSPN